MRTNDKDEQKIIQSVPSTGDDIVSGDKINVGNISDSYAAIGSEARVTVNNIVYNYGDADATHLRQKLTKANEQRWHQTYEHLRTEANAGYIEAVQNLIIDIITEVKQYEADEAPVDTELKALIYRLAAVSYLPRHANGDSQRCSEYLDKALELSQGENLTKCQITQAFLQYDTGNVTAALETLSSIFSDEALRFRFAIFIENNQIDECRQLINEGAVELAWSLTNPDWARAILSYYALAGNKEAAQRTAESLVEKRPTASSYQIAAFNMLRLAFVRVQDFCQAHEIFPDFYVALDLSELIDFQLQSLAAHWFAKAAKLFAHHACPQEAIRMYTNAIRLCLDKDTNKTGLAEWTAALAKLDPENPILTMLKRPEFGLSDAVGAEPTIVDLAQLLSNPTAELTYILKLANAVAKAKSLAAEVAKLLQNQFDRFHSGSESEYAQYVFTGMQLWHIAKNPKRAKKWLKRTTQHLSHPRLKPLLYAWHYVNLKNHKLAASWIERSLVTLPDHPELIAAAIVVYRLRQDNEKVFQYAQQLFEIVRTQQTADYYLSTLWLTNQYEKFLDTLNQLEDVRFEEQYIRNHRIQALQRLGRITETRTDLEWLISNDLALPWHLRQLATVYNLLGDIDKTIVTLRECISLASDEPEFYLALADAYLHAGRYDEAFLQAQKAAQRFSDNPRTLSYLVFVAFTTGHELLPEVGEAFRALLPKGQFAAQSPFFAMSLDEFKEQLQQQHQHKEQLETMYRLGRIPRSFYCLWRGVPMFLAHTVANDNGQPRFVAQGQQNQTINRLRSDCPRQIVLDYSALLTVWTLFENDLLEILTRYFDKIYIPETLRFILLDEQDHLMKQGQRARYKAQCEVRDMLTFWANKVTIHQALDRQDVSGFATELALAEKQHHIYFNEHFPPSEPKPMHAIGIAAMADLLANAGEIDALIHQEVTRFVHLLTDSEIELFGRLQNERECVISLSTLVTWTMHADLTPLFTFLEHIHVAEPARIMLLGDIAKYEYNQLVSSDLGKMRQHLQQAEKNGLVEFHTIPYADYHIRHEQEEQAVEDDKATHFRLMRSNWLGFYDELLGFANQHQLPIWTDDAVTATSLNTNPKQAPFAFSTDSFLTYIHQYPETTSSFGAEQYHAYYNQLIKWGYYFLPLNPEHILWQLHHGRQVSKKPLSMLLQYYREQLLSWWRIARSQSENIVGQGVQILSNYQQQWLITMYRLYKANTSAEVCAALFAELDLSRYAGELIQGNEPLMIESLIMHMLMADVAGEQDDEQESIPTGQLLDYSHWLGQVMYQSQVPIELLDEAWYRTLHVLLPMLDKAQITTQRQLAAILIDRTLNAIPIPHMEYVLTTDIGIRLQNEFGLEVFTVFPFNLKHETRGNLEFRLPAEKWDKDYQLAIKRYVEERPKTAVTVGDVRLKAEFVAPGSIFLKSDVLPAEIYKQYPEVQGSKHIDFLLPGFNNSAAMYRDALWQVGLEAFQQHQIDTTDWMAQRGNLLQDGPAGQRAGTDARRILLSKWPISQTYFAQAAKLHPASVIQLLECIEPMIVHDWLSLSTIDWKTPDDLQAWATQLPLSLSQDQPVLDFVKLFTHYRYSLFPDAPVIRQRLQALLLNLPEAAQLASIQQILEAAKTSNSLISKANTVLIVHSWLPSAAVKGDFDQNSLNFINERANNLTARILHGSMGAEEQEAAINFLESLICRWLYQTWNTFDPNTDFSERFEITYLATQAAGLITDALVTKGKASPQTVVEVNKRLLDKLKLRPFQLSFEPQPPGFYRPLLCDSVNYAAAYLLHGLLTMEESPIFLTHKAIKEAALQCGTTHRIVQAILTGVEQNPTWLDNELTIDISRACIEILGDINEQDATDWPANQQYQALIAASPTSAFVLAKHSIDTLPDLDSQEEILYRIDSLFLGRIQPTPLWYELLASFFQSNVLDKVRTYSQTYADVLAHIGLMIIQPDTDCPPELLNTIHELLLEVPVGDNSAELIETKAYVLRQLLLSGLDITFIQQWLQNIAADEHINLSAKRLALRPFIFFWSQYSQKSRDSLYKILMEVAELPAFRGLWEFERLARDRVAVAQASQHG